MYNPSIDMGHQLVTFRRRQKLRRADHIAGFIPHPQQHLNGRAVADPPSQRNDRLGVQLEAVFLQRNLDTLQPLDLSALASNRLVPRGIYVDSSAALLLGDIAGGISGAQHALHGATGVAYFHQANTDADVEYLVLPNEPMVSDRLAGIISDLAGLFQGTPDQ